MSKAGIELLNVSKEFAAVGAAKDSTAENSTAGKAALKNIDLTIGPGEFVGIIGRNGSGKTTLARLINGLILPTTGKVLINGLDTTDNRSLTEIRRQVGMVFQNPDNQIISSIVEEDIAFGPENLGCSAREVKERVDWALKAVGMEEMRQHAPHLLSGGQKQKIAIAAVLAMRPNYLILDEPTSMLDPRGRLELIENLRILNKEHGITIILTSHQMEDFAYAGRLLVLEQGELYLDDTPAKIFYSTEKLAKVGLTPPETVQLINGLRHRGCRIENDLISAEQLVEYFS